MTKLYYLLLLIFIYQFSLAQETTYLKASLKSGEGAYAFLERFGLDRKQSTVDRFETLNQLKNLNLQKDKAYKLPIKVYRYNGTSIRTTIGNNDYDHAVKIQKYNDLMFSRKVKDGDYRKDNILWVPEVLSAVQKTVRAETNPKSKGIYPIFGKEFENIELKSSKLKGHVYYVVAGHGGPDPGAVIKYGGHTLCEDEYAYDISLRLARNLLEHNATVYMITIDKNDGIRNEAYLKLDHDEVCYPNKKIPLNQVKRLNQRVDAINVLYKKHKTDGAKKQRAIIIHVDSRGKGQRIDMFFYHSPKSTKGKEMATTLKNTIKQKYELHQSGRGYSGTVKARNLHMLRETHPVAVYAELGNIRNTADQKRFIIEDNRQAVANWLCEGILKDK